VFVSALKGFFVRARGQRAASIEAQTDYQELGDRPASLHSEYEHIILGQLARWGIRDGLVSVEVQELAGRRKKPAFQATLCINQWHREETLRVLVGLPLLEKKVRRAAAALWISDVSTLQSLLVTTAPALQERGPCSELRQLLVGLTGESTATRSTPSANPSVARRLVLISPLNAWTSGRLVIARALAAASAFFASVP